MSGDYTEQDNSSASADGNDTQPQDQAYHEILAEVDKQQSRQKSWIKNIIILAVSLLIFFQLGLFEGGLHGVVRIILVLLIHETGHLAGMRLFGYINVRMFFIPFFGAAVSGESRNVATYKRAIISLLGPGPGIIIGCVLMLMFAATGRENYLNLAGMFLFINCFNLLPFYPLDGGRLLHLVVFSRNRYLELCFRIFAALALILVGYALGAWLLAMLGLFNLWAVRLPFKLAKIGKEVRQFSAYEDSLDALADKNADSETVPMSTAKVIIDKVYEHFPPPVEVSAVARYTKDIWERICFRPSGVFSTLTLLTAYLFMFCLPFIALTGSMIVSVIERNGFVESKLVQYERADGLKGLKEQFYFYGKLNSEVEVDSESYLYHGRDINYADANRIRNEGTWRQGKLDGEWKVYDVQGNLMRVTVYNEGNFVSRREKVDGQWLDREWENLPSLAKWRIRRYQKKPHGPNARQD